MLMEKKGEGEREYYVIMDEAGKLTGQGLEC